MSLTDPISNLLTSIRNAAQTKKETVDVPASKLTEKILSIFKDTGYIEDFRLLKDNAQGTFKIYLKYDNKRSTIIGLKRVSRPGLRIYVRRDRIPRVLNGLGTAVISTSKGVITNKEAYKMKIGGEVLCYIW
ncbi:MAG: 30S ribosomal protein S8 [Omnitrophica WOR_2 bacterium GWA2_47_8]|nr:MAG: 30S ribosomal protein S8 [Omnitrophica WOR_2 bacterium GWA2_47_8]